MARRRAAGAIHRSGAIVCDSPPASTTPRPTARRRQSGDGAALHTLSILNTRPVRSVAKSRPLGIASCSTAAGSSITARALLSGASSQRTREVMPRVAGFTSNVAAPTGADVHAAAAGGAHDAAATRRSPVAAPQATRPAMAAQQLTARPITSSA
jgi:hypothetical protein